MHRKLPGQIRATRGSNRQNAPSADRSVVSAWRGIEARRPPLPGARWPSRRSPAAAGSPPFWRPETWLAPNVIGAWGVTTLSANRAGDDSWVAGIELATASEPRAEASDLGALPFGRRPQPPLSCNPLLNHASFGHNFQVSPSHSASFWATRSRVGRARLRTGFQSCVALRSPVLQRPGIEAMRGR